MNHGALEAELVDDLGVRVPELRQHEVDVRRLEVLPSVLVDGEAELHRAKRGAFLMEQEGRRASQKIENNVSLVARILVFHKARSLRSSPGRR